MCQLSECLHRASITHFLFTDSSLALSDALKRKTPPTCEATPNPTPTPHTHKRTFVLYAKLITFTLFTHRDAASLSHLLYDGVRFMCISRLWPAIANVDRKSSSWLSSANSVSLKTWNSLGEMGLGPISQVCQPVLLPKLEPTRCPTWSTNSMGVWLLIIWSIREDRRLLRTTFKKRFFPKNMTSRSKLPWSLEDYARRVLAPAVWVSNADIYSLETFSETHCHSPCWRGEWRGRLPVTILFQANGIFQKKKEPSLKEESYISQNSMKTHWYPCQCVTKPLTNWLLFCCFGAHQKKMPDHITWGQSVSLYVCDIKTSTYSQAISHKGFMPGDIWFLLCFTNVCRSFQ